MRVYSGTGPKLSEVGDTQQQFNRIPYHEAFKLHVGSERVVRFKQTKTVFQRKRYWLNTILICALLEKLINIRHTLGHKTSLNKCKRIGVIQNMFSKIKSY